MTTIALACSTMRDEITYVAAELKAGQPILWIDSGLHNVPEKLGKAIQEQLNRIENVDNTLLLFGSCGNALVGLSSPYTRLVVPRVEDCISLFLGGNERRRVLEKQAPAYYLTKGYLQNEKSLWNEYSYCFNKYGEQRAKKIFQKMLNNYQKLRVIDTGAFDPEEISAETNKMAQTLGLTHEVTKGSLSILYKALQEHWDEDFLIMEPGETISWEKLNNI